MPGYITIKLLKMKEKTEKQPEGKQFE